MHTVYSYIVYCMHTMYAYSAYTHCMHTMFAYNVCCNLYAYNVVCMLYAQILSSMIEPLVQMCSVSASRLNTVDMATYMTNCLYLIQKTVALYEYTDNRLEMLQAQVRLALYEYTNNCTVRVHRQQARDAAGSGKTLPCMSTQTVALYEYTDNRLEMLQAQVRLLPLVSTQTVAQYEYTDKRLDMLQAQFPRLPQSYYIRYIANLMYLIS